MSEFAWMRIMEKVAKENPDGMLSLAEDINNQLDRAQVHDFTLESFRELAWRQGYIHQLVKIAVGREPATNGPLVQLFPGLDSGWPLEPVFEADHLTLPRYAYDEDGNLVTLD